MSTKLQNSFTAKNKNIGNYSYHVIKHAYRKPQTSKNFWCTYKRNSLVN